MSKLDWFTILIIAVCVLAIGALVWNAKNLYQGTKSATDTELSEDYDDSNVGRDSEELAIDIDGDADGDNGISTTGGKSDGGTIKYDSDVARQAAEADAEEARIAEREAAEAAARNNAVSDRINTNTSPSTRNSGANVGGGNTGGGNQATARDSEGAFMVLIGSYRQMISAEKMLRSVRAKGYREARIEKFDNGTYARVLVGSRKTLNSARDLQAELVSDGFRDILVKTKQ